jgi:SAM-dependent methyltransferase
MRSATRIECDNAVKEFSDIINRNYISKQNNLLYVGIAGDPPGGEYSSLFSNAKIITYDKDPKWNPQLVGDIVDTKFQDNSWDTIVCVQVLEHIEKLFRLPEELHRIVKSKGHVIIDCPWNYPYHAEPPSFKDFWRISKDGMETLFSPWFKLIKIISGNHNTSCLLEKP